MLLSSLGTSIANVGLPTLAEAFGASFQQVQWVVLAYLLAITTLIVSAGRLGDLIGRRRLLMAGIVLFTVACALCSLAPTLGLLIAARTAQGFGAAIMMALTMASVADAVPKARAGSAMGLLGTMSAVGTALGPSLGGVLIAGFGWPFMFLVNVPLGMVAVLLVHRFLPADGQRAKADDGRPRFDHPGTLLLALSLASYALAMTLGRGSFGLLNVTLLGAALHWAPAQAEEQPRLFELLGQPGYKATWHAMFKGESDVPKWVSDASGPSSPSTSLSLEGQPYVLANSCKPHDCGNNRLLVADKFSLAQRLWLCTKGAWWLYGPGGIFARNTRNLLDYYRPGFHPWQHNNLDLLYQTRREFDAQPDSQLA